MQKELDSIKEILGKAEKVKKELGILNVSNSDKLINKGVSFLQEQENVFDKYIGKHVICRTYSAGVHYGILSYKNGKECILKNTRRIWYWDGAASLSQLAKSGTSKPENCKFPEKIDEIILTEVIEIILCADKAVLSIDSVISWEK